MEQLETNLSLIIDILGKKKEALETVLNITLNQDIVIGSTEDESNSIFLIMNEEKQRLIDEVLKIDSILERKLSNIAKELEDEKTIKKSKNKISIMQNKIIEIITIDQDIRDSESKNKNKISKRQGNLAGKINALELYNKEKREVNVCKWN